MLNICKIIKKLQSCARMVLVTRYVLMRGRHKDNKAAKPSGKYSITYGIRSISQFRIPIGVLNILWNFPNMLKTSRNAMKHIMHERHSSYYSHHRHHRRRYAFSSRCPILHRKRNFGLFLNNAIVPKNFRTFNAVPYYSLIIIIYVWLFILWWMGNLLSLHLRSK